MIRRLLVICVGLALASGVGRAQWQTLQVDPARSQVQFTLSDPLHVVNGTFKVEQGSIDFNPADGSIEGGITVDAASGASGNSTRDKKMKTEQMQAAKYSTVSFAPTHFTGTLNPTGDSNINVSGTFVLLGQPHEITVPMTVHRDGSECRAQGSFIVPYVQWGMKDPSVFLLHVSKQVKVSLDLLGTVRQ